MSLRLRPGEITIRPARLDDYPAIFALVRQLPGAIRRWTDAGHAQIFENLLKGGGQEAFVATLRERVVGFLSLYYMRVLHHGGVVASIQEIVVTEELRGRGIGRELLDFARARARDLQCAATEMAHGFATGLGSRTVWRRDGRNLPTLAGLLDGGETC